MDQLPIERWAQGTPWRGSEGEVDKCLGKDT